MARHRCHISSKRAASPGRNGAEMGPANSLLASVQYSEYNERFDLKKLLQLLSVKRKPILRLYWKARYFEHSMLLLKRCEAQCYNWHKNQMYARHKMTPSHTTMTRWCALYFRQYAICHEKNSPMLEIWHIGVRCNHTRQLNRKNVTLNSCLPKNPLILERNIIMNLILFQDYSCYQLDLNWHTRPFHCKVGA